MKFENIIGMVLLLLGIFAGVLGAHWFQDTKTASIRTAMKPELSESTELETKRRVLYWANPMNSKIHSDRPMKDNMGMNYIPVYASGTSSSEVEGIGIDSRQTQNMGVRLVTVQKRLMGRAIQTVGTVTVDQNRIYSITPRFSGWVERLNVRAVGDSVAKGQILAKIYSPELYSAQQEYLVARQQASIDSRESGLLAGSLEKLHLLGMPGGAMKTLEKTGKPMKYVPVLASESGIVTALNIRQGGYVSSRSSLFEIANLDRVWINVAIYAYQLSWINIGDAVQLALPTYPGQHWRGRLGFLYPTLDPRTRTVTARLSFDNPRGFLRPGMYANATVLADSKSNLAIPSSAVIRTQEGDYVMLAQAQGHYLPVEVALGPEANGWVAILKGLKTGDRVVDNAQFMLYSESQFQSVKARLLGSNVASKIDSNAGLAPSIKIPGRASHAPSNMGNTVAGATHD
ncbi:efflux transporter periplasmic adaptor subunit [Acidihalobacter yilgarnensis]|uniref:Efflux transporter periplasmic adaptor subunit n=1 Tax=Acidihalobacter yilgarnensis TaxID=2819280 RepID=A0A1D8IR07_9GAMM|nr:efflux RND transporter periplasmic adaptor subunit [Acidihalobacter yilgarnensis]AOU98837.1 efflux transporter periplasmic adaptor subunit [Acidihalobacter yilgarnensis]